MTDADSSTDTTKILLVRQIHRKTYFIFARRFYTIYEQKFSNLRPLTSITFPQGFWKSKIFWHWTLGSGGTTTFKLSKQMKKKKQLKTFFLPRWCYTLYEKSFQIWDHFLQLLFPKNSENLKSLDLGHQEVGENNVKWSEKHWYQKNLFS